MIMSSGLTVRRPSHFLKEKLMNRLESHKDSMDILEIVLRIDISQSKTVQEVIAIAEEKNGELFFETWRLIYDLLDLTKDFKKLVDADHWPMTDPINTLESPLQDQYPKDTNHNAHQRSVHEYAQHSNKPEEPVSNKSKELRLKNRYGCGDLSSNLDATHPGMRFVEETQKTRSLSHNWPEWSLPPPSGDNQGQETRRTTPMGLRTYDREHHDLVVDEVGERSVSSVWQNLQQIQENCSFQPVDQNGQILQESRRISWGSDISPPAHAVHETPAGQCQQAVTLDTDEGADEEDSSGSASQTDTIPSLYSVDSGTSSSGSRPLTPEGANGPMGSITGVASQEIDVVGTTGLSEIGDTTENSGYFLQSIRERSSGLEAYQFELECYRRQCVQQQGTIDEFQRILDGSLHLEEENQRLIRMTQELCVMKDQDIERLAQLFDQKDQDNERLTEEILQLREEHMQEIERLRGEHMQEIERLRGEYIQRINQMNQRSECMQTQIANLRKESQELSEELQQTVEEVRQSYQRKLGTERECMRRDNETLLDQRMTELAQAFNNAETDEVKRMKLEIVKEKRKRREAEDHSLFKAMVNELMLRRAELVESSYSTECAETGQDDFGSNSTESTEVEDGEESDDCDEVFEDALYHL